jgi:hypothetical protein
MLYCVRCHCGHHIVISPHYESQTSRKPIILLAAFRETRPIA